MIAEPTSSTESHAQTAAPALSVSVVVVPLIGGAALENCVRAVAAQADEVLVVAAPPSVFTEADAPRYIGGGDEPVPAKRLLGLSAARFPVVAFIEDTCQPAPGWCDAIREAFAADDVAGVCGSVEVSKRLPAPYRALGLLEYARFRSSVLARRGGASLAGANFAIRGAEIGPSADMVDGALLAILKAKGRVVAAPVAAVVYDGIDKRGAQLSTRFHHGRIYGGGVSNGRPLAARIVLTVKALAAPLVQFGRVCRDAPGFFWQSPLCLGWTLAMLWAWASGEALGAMTGRIGDSMRRWT